MELLSAAAALTTLVGALLYALSYLAVDQMLSVYGITVDEVGVSTRALVLSAALAAIPLTGAALAWGALIARFDRKWLNENRSGYAFASLTSMVAPFAATTLAFSLDAVPAGSLLLVFGAAAQLADAYLFRPVATHNRMRGQLLVLGPRSPWLVRWWRRNRSAGITRVRSSGEVA